MSDPFLKPEHVQGSPEWLEMRKNYIGSSDAAAAIGESPWTTPLQLWEQKVGVAAPPQVNAAMRRGTEMEPLARQAFENDIGIEVYPQVVYHPHHKFMISSLDGLSLDGTIAVELKSPMPKAHAIALEGRVPDYNVTQCQHHLACLGHPMIWYYSYDGIENAAIKVPRHDEYIEKMIAAEEKFWDCVLNLIPPPHTNKDYDSRDTPTWASIGQRIAEIDKACESYETLQKEKASLRLALIDDAGDRSCRGGGVTLTRSFPKGRIDYGAIPELESVDLDQYRKQPKETWTLRVKKEKV